MASTPLLRTPSRSITRAVLALLLAAVAGAAEADTEITSCGTLRYAGTGVLTADLDCSADPLTIEIDGSGSVALQGFTLTAATIRCVLNDCTVDVVGPGTLAGSIEARRGELSDATIVNGHLRGQRWKVRHARFEGPSTSCAIRLIQDGGPSRLQVSDDTVITGADCGIIAEGVATIEDTVIENSAGLGIEMSYSGYNPKLKMRGCTVRDNGDTGIYGYGVTILDSTITGNGGDGIVVASAAGDVFGKAKVKRSTVSGNAYSGVVSDDVASVSASFVEANGFFGVVAVGDRPARVAASRVAGNGVDVACGVGSPCADIAGTELPQIGSKTVCDTSYQYGSGVPGSSWGICALD